jgi:hypothetical protein
MILRSRNLFTQANNTCLVFELLKPSLTFCLGCLPEVISADWDIIRWWWVGNDQRSWYNLRCYVVDSRNRPVSHSQVTNRSSKTMFLGCEYQLPLPDTVLWRGVQLYMGKFYRISRNTVQILKLVTPKPDILHHPVMFTSSHFTSLLYI